MQAVIMAGGKGSRLAAITKNEIPKPMVPLLDKPLLLWQVEKLKEYGCDHITMIIGYLGQSIVNFFGDGSRLGITIDYIEEKEPLGTAGSFYYLKDRISEPYFFLIFGDVFFDIDMDRMLSFHKEKNAKLTLLAHPNAHPYDSDLITTDKSDKVVGFDSKNNTRDYWYDNLVNAGIYILNSDICDKVKKPVKTDFEHDIIADMIKNGEAVYAYRTPEYVKDVGTVDRIEKTIEDIKSGFIEKKNLKNKQSAIFLDRDGCINVEKSFLYNIDDLELYPYAAEAIKKINSSGKLAIVITNQPVIARGECSIKELEEIHKKLKTLLGRQGAYIDDIYYCPHHPNKGFEGERAEYKIKCHCRKPEIGMLEAAAAKYNIDFSSSWMIGDMTSDVKTGENAGTHTALLMSGVAGSDNRYEVKPDMICENLLEAADRILQDY